MLLGADRAASRFDAGGVVASATGFVASDTAMVASAEIGRAKTMGSTTAQIVPANRLGFPERRRASPSAADSFSWTSSTQPAQANVPAIMPGDRAGLRGALPEQRRDEERQERRGAHAEEGAVAMATMPPPSWKASASVTRNPTKIPTLAMGTVRSWCAPFAMTSGRGRARWRCR